MPNNEVNFRDGRERIIILALCIVGACRIFLFSAAFPFFNNVDERLHFDLVYKYSIGRFPRAGVENLSRGASELILLYETPEYLTKPDPNGSLPLPLWKYRNLRKTKLFAMELSKLQRWNNWETWSFPVYYMIAGLWCAAGRLLGIEDGNLLYWIRFLNVPLFAVFVWFSYYIGRTLFPNTTVQRVGLPLMVTFFPQDTFYAISNDCLSPLLFTVAFFLLMQVYFENKSYSYHLLGGLAIAATFLTKISNVSILALLGLIVALKIRQVLLEKRFKKYLPLLVTLFIGVTIPVGIWFARNHIVFGELTGVAETIRFKNWTAKPLSELWTYPIFTPAGLFYFLTKLTQTFWRGEFVWHLRRIASPSMDWFYVISTAVCLFLSGLGLILNRGKKAKRHEFIIAMSFFVVTVSVLLLAVLSILYDFGDWPYPTRERPFFISGRLIGGVLLPFLVIYLDGLRRLLSKLTNRHINPLFVVIVIVIVITCSELLLTLEVFRSPYNWFHLK